MRVGIDKLRLYPSTLALSLAELCVARDRHPEETIAHLLVKERTVLPPWEDSVTLAVNAAAPLVDDGEREAIGLLIVGTETPVDLEKPISSWVHRHLGLSSECRNYDLQHACYSVTAAVQLALAWLSSPAGRGKKALVVGSDASLFGLGEPWEFILGAGAVALLLGEEPRFAAIDPGASGVYACEVTDVIRPSRRIETGSSEESLFAYLEAVGGAHDAWVEKNGAWSDFAGCVYHSPFPGITFRAHQTLLRQNDAELSRAEAWDDFERRVLPGLCHHRRTGALYGSSTFASLLGMVDARPELGPGDALSVFAFGSGSCAELYRVELGADVRAMAAAAGAGASIEAREAIDVATYEALERERAASVEQADYRPSPLETHFARAWQGKGRLFLCEVESWVRSYAWS